MSQAHDTGVTFVTVFTASLAAVCGLLAGAYLQAAWLALLAAAASAVCPLLPRPHRKRILCHALICILAGLYFQGYDYLHRSTLLPMAEDGETIVVAGVIDSPVKRDGDTARLFLSVETWGKNGRQMSGMAAAERIALRVRLSREPEAREAERWMQGSRLSATVRLSLPSPARNPHAFDYARYLRWQGVRVTAEAEYGDIRVEPAESGVMMLFRRWQTEAADRIALLFPDQEAAGYMQSLLLGITDGVSPETEEMYDNLGLSHVLAISGLHVTLVSGMFVWSVERAGMPRRPALALTMVLLAGYVLIVGAGASAVRAGIMGAIGLLCQAGARQAEGRDVWGWALLLMLGYNPYYLWHLGFQLSFGVTLGLIVLVPVGRRFFTRGPEWLRTSLAVTFAAQAVSFPFLIYHFHQFSPLSWLVNLLAVPLLSMVVLPAGYLALLLGLIHPALAVLPVRLASALLRWLHGPLFWLEELAVPFSHWPHPQWWWIAVYALFLAALPVLWRRGYHRPRDRWLYAALFLFLLAAARQPFADGDEVRITFLDVGQGDSIVVEVGKKKVYLIDAGGTPRYPARESWRERRDPFEVGKDVVLPFLRARGIERIDHVVMTHGDHDHIGGMAALVPRFAFGSVLVNGTPPREEEAAILERFRARRVPVLTGRPGQTWTDVPGVEWTWLHPDGDSAHTGNDASVVLRLTAYGTTVLFTGDIERAGEEQLLSRSLPSPVDVLKVAHHGSSTSSSPALLAAAKPRSAVISAGRNNRYGHPSPVVVKRLMDTGADVYRTDLQGAVTLVIRKGSVHWQTQITDI
jgi:competence protein ComEC